ncbi:MAG: hypothetical protein DI585_01380 [Pseudomonas fluorescens]|nr:MAG: hypothetical protein DI585_01380 [Pseudomonas fluorescens]
MGKRISDSKTTTTDKDSQAPVSSDYYGAQRKQLHGSKRNLDSDWEQESLARAARIQAAKDKGSTFQNS